MTSRAATLLYRGRRLILAAWLVTLVVAGLSALSLPGRLSVAYLAVTVAVLGALVAVFGGFSFIGLLPMRQLGFGLAVAVALDATIVRLVLVPAFMRLAGRWNWWLPARHRVPAGVLTGAGAR